MAKKKGRKRQQKKLQQNAAQQDTAGDKPTSAEATDAPNEADGDDEDDEDDSPEAEGAAATESVPPPSPADASAIPGGVVSPISVTPGGIIETPAMAFATKAELEARGFKEAAAKLDAKDPDAQQAEQPAPPVVSAGWPARLADFLTDQFEFSTSYAWVLIAVVVFAAYANSLWKVPFLFDDAPVITRNRNFRELSWNNFVAVVKQPPPITRSLSNLTFYANYQIAGTPAYQLPDGPYAGTYGPTWTYHVFNTVLHAFNGILLFTLLSTLLAGAPSVRATAARRASLQGKSPPPNETAGDPISSIAPWVALGATLIWLVHPINTMAVTYIAQRYAMCAAATFLGTLVCYVKLRRRIEAGTAWNDSHFAGSVALVAGTIFCFLLCYTTKENATLAALVVPAIELCFFRARQVPESDQVIEWIKRWTLPLGLTGFFVASLAGGAALFGVQAVFPDRCPTFPDRSSYFFTEWVVLLKYLRLFALPNDLTVEQAFPGLSWTEETAREEHLEWHPYALGGALVAHLLILVLAVKWWRSGRKFLSFAVAWYYITLAIESSIIPILDPMVEHRLYIPSMLLAGAVAYALGRTALWLYELGPEWTKTAIPDFLGILSVDKPDSLDSPDTPLGLVASMAVLGILAVTGVMALQAGSLGAAAFALGAAALFGVVVPLALKGRVGELMIDLRAQVLGVRQAVSMWVLGAWIALIGALGLGTFFRNQVWNSATGIWQDTIDKRPDCARAYSSLGMEMLYNSDWLEAVAPIEEALYLGPYHVEGWNNIGKAYLEIGSALPNNGAKAVYPCPPLEWARMALERGIEVNEVAPSPSVPLCWNNLGLTYMKMAERLQGKDEATEKEKARLERKASVALYKACEIDKGYETAWINLGTCLTKEAERATGAERKDLAREAVAAFANSHATNPNHQLFALCARNLALAYRAAGMHAAAFKVLLMLVHREEQMSAAEGHDVDASWQEMMQGLIAAEAADASEELAEGALELERIVAAGAHPSESEAALADEIKSESQIGASLAQEWDKVVQHCETRAAELGKGDHPYGSKLYRQAARILIARKRLEHGEKDYDLALEVTPAADRPVVEEERRKALARAARIPARQQGPMGPQGPTGPQAPGPQGPQGPTGPELPGPR